MRKSGTEVVVSELPMCDLCKQRGVEEPANYDGRTRWGAWAYMCERHFAEVGAGLGIGVGQQLTLEAPKKQEIRTYTDWMKRVDRVLIHKVGLTSADLEDWASRDCYDSGMTPAEGAQVALESSDLYGMMEF